MASKVNLARKLLLINAHQVVPKVSPGRLNETMVKVISEEMANRGYEIRHTHIEKGYDINEEVEKHVWADLIILQSPVFWFGTPWIYKKYADEILTAGLVQQKLSADDGRSRKKPTAQYGTGGKMHGKKYMISLTWNAPEESFGDKNQFLFAGRTVDDVFFPNMANYKFCGAEILPSFSCFNVVKNPQIETDIARLRDHLSKYT